MLPIRPLTDALAEVPIGVAAPVVVLALVALRWRYGSVLLDLRFVHAWNVARRVAIPLVDRVAKRAFGSSIAENKATEAEHVADFDESVRDLCDRIQAASDRDFEVSALAGLKTDWEGNREAASIVGFEGPRPFPGAPDWLRADQVHVFMFTLPDGGTRVCAHMESNSYRPDRWHDHLYKGPTYSPDRGVRATEAWLAEADA